MKNILIAGILALASVPTALACTSAIIGPEASANGRPLLWKHRDTSTVDNKVEYIAPKDGAFGYVALFNAGDTRLREAWTGMNDAGFAIMNTASYNIKDDKVPNSNMDREGEVMTIALRTCRTVDDFDKLLRTLPRPMGVEANFGVIDAEGNGAYFETNNHSFKRFNLSDAPGHVLVRTNYSHSGRKGEGYGFVREANAEHLLKEHIEARDITPMLLTEEISRSFWHDLKGKDYTKAGERWVIDEDFIPRYKSTATVVIEGMKPVDDASEVTPQQVADQYIMWTGLGYPPCSEIYPVRVEAGGVPDDLRGIGPNGHAPAADRAKARRNDVFTNRRGEKGKYIDMNKLVNDQGTGYIQILVPQNMEVYEKLEKNR